MSWIGSLAVRRRNGLPLIELGYRERRWLFLPYSVRLQETLAKIRKNVIYLAILADVALTGGRVANIDAAAWDANLAGDCTVVRVRSAGRLRSRSCMKS